MSTDCPCPYHPHDCYGHVMKPQTCGCAKPPRSPLSVNCNISSTSLGEAARLLGPSFVYDLYVNPYLIIDTRSVLRRMQPTEYEDNPLIPYINLHTDESLAQQEWYLSANGKSVGSSGV